ncbi:MAG: amino acid ABC transporter substrate-binding protein [Ancylobacter novellus]|uniref:Amino acid ABC transporter substrate-binding protein n=1 Tax=Ancylobacter novellus TaxID=921 RepID=A0A2W5KMU3_ANCNO|nr:MAG: amino acid ABC transporter substrate-binding protein [Ancylobacter novellus]
MEHRDEDASVKDAERTALGRRSFLGAVGGGAVGLGLLSGINQAHAAKSGTIPIGAMVSLTGPLAVDGVEHKHGLELACEEINAAGGILGKKVEPIVIDSKGQSAEEVTAAARLLLDRHQVHAIVNGYNVGANQAEYDPIADAGIIYIHYNTTIGHNETFKSDPEKYFGIFMADPAEYYYGVGLPVMLDSLRKLGKWKPKNNKIALITGSLPYSVVISNAIRETAPKYGFEVSFEEVVPVPTTEWGAVLSKIRAQEPAVIANTHFYPGDIAQCQVQFLQNPTDSLMYYQYGALLKAFSTIAGPAALGVLTSSVIGILPDEIGTAFQAKYKAKYGAKAEADPGASVYAEMIHYALAAALAGGTGAPGDVAQNRKIAENLRNYSYRAPFGMLRYDPATNSALPYPTLVRDPSIAMPHLLYQIKDPAADVPKKLISPAPYNDAEFDLPPWFKA